MPDDSILVRAKEFLLQRGRSYRRVFLPLGPDVEAVLYDLAKFCRADRSTFHADPRIHAMLEGRREVWNRICHHLRLSDQELWDLYGNKRLTDKARNEGQT